MQPNRLTRRRFSQITGAAAMAAVGGLSPFRSSAQPRNAPLSVEDILAGPARGPWRRLFLDAAVVEAHEGLARVFHAVEKFSGNPVIKADKPWEGVAAITGP